MSNMYEYDCFLCYYTKHTVGIHTVGIHTMGIHTIGTYTVGVHTVGVHTVGIHRAAGTFFNMVRTVVLWWA